MNRNDIANLALAKIGWTKGVVDFNTESSNEARVIKMHFTSAFKKTLEAHPWEFASEEAPLLLVGPGKFGFKHMYAYPANCITIRQIAPQGCFVRVNLQTQYQTKWQHYYQGGVNKTIVCDVDDAYAQYTVELSPELDFPSHFGDAVAANLSLAIAPSIIANNYAKLKQDLLNTAENDIAVAIATDIGKQPQTNNAPSTYEISLLRG